MSSDANRLVVIGVISDTHGLLRAEAVESLRGAELILHAGDIGSPDVIPSLESLAPVIAVRGNCDQGSWAEVLPLRRSIEVGEVSILVLHDRKELKLLPPETAVQVVVSGHSHVPSLAEEDGVLYLNPGSAGAKRFKLPVSVALLKVQGAQVKAEIVQLSA
jgi:uncharacterized protein